MEKIQKISPIFILLICVVALFIAFTFQPTVADAQYRQSEGYFDYDDENWQRHRDFSRYNDEIDNLDNNIVEELPIPVLFGVDLSDIYPNFGDSRGGGTRVHEGLDMLVSEGTPIVSPTKAIVTRIGNGASSGIYVRTANPGGERFVYMHLLAVADNLDRGDELDVGDLIGYVGDTGNAIGTPHLHFEIWEGRDVKDPYDRITNEFSLREKIEFTENILANADDSDEVAEFLATEYGFVFIQARAEGLDIPEKIIDKLPNQGRLSATGRDLTIGSRGEDVSTLQSRLIVTNFLNISTPTGYFGPLTEAALAAYQQANDISPAIGYYGPITREHMAESNESTEIIDNLDYDLDNISRSEMISLIETLQEIIINLQAQLN